MNVAAIFAGGVGQRMKNTALPKQFLEVNGKAIIIQTLEVFENSKEIDAIAISCLEDYIPYLTNLCKKHNLEKVKWIVPGGSTGQMSIYNALTVIEENTNEDEVIVLVHDGVRPLIDESLINENIKCVKSKGNAITCTFTKETVVTTNEKGLINGITERKNTMLAKAPQSFYLNDILQVHRQAMSEGCNDSIDSCTLMSNYGRELYIVEGNYDNIKITTPEDFYSLRAFIEYKENVKVIGE